MVHRLKRLFRRKRFSGGEIYPDEIFLDARNLPQFDVHQFEGRIEKPISKKTIILLGLAFLLIELVFLWRIGILQIVKGEAYTIKSENNRLQQTPIFSERGIIYDRNGQELVWNAPDEENAFYTRAYTQKKGLAHILGYVGYPAKDNNGYYYQTSFTGKDGVEQFYNNILNGKNGIKVVEVDALQNVQSESIVEPPKEGENITLTIDADVQEKLYQFIDELALERGFQGGAAVIMDVHSGEILALTSYPEYSSQVLSDGQDRDAINQYVTNKHTPFLNRIISGLYTPGSIVKPFMAMGALEEGVISPDKKILSTGSISVPNPYDPTLKTVFTDWKAHGWVNVKEALAVSSNVYFYEIGGGFGDQKGIGIEKIGTYMDMFGVGKITGVDLNGEVEGTIPNPEWKAKVFDGEPWRIGDTYNTSIGQYGFQVTPIQMIRAVASIANGGKLVTPHIKKGEEDIVSYELPVDQKNIDIVKDGMRLAVLHGTAAGLSTPYVDVAAKTGTAEVGVDKKQVNSWVVGFYPYEDPKYAFTVVMEKGPRANTVGGLYIARRIIDWMALNKKEYMQ